jgi:hypothetical protein
MRFLFQVNEVSDVVFTELKKEKSLRRSPSDVRILEIESWSRRGKAININRKKLTRQSSPQSTLLTSKEESNGGTLKIRSILRKQELPLKFNVTSFGNGNCEINWKTSDNSSLQCARESIVMSLM